MKNINKLLELLLIFFILIILNLMGMFPVYVTIIVGVVVAAINDDELKRLFTVIVIPLSIVEDIINIQLLGLTVVISVLAMIVVYSLSKVISDISLRVLVGMILGHIIGILAYLIITSVIFKRSIEFLYIWDSIGSIIVGIILGIIYTKIFVNSLLKVKV